jgi:hypothetical protein
MNLPAKAREWIKLGRKRKPAPDACGDPGEESLVIAVTNCYPTRILLYATAFQADWRMLFAKSLGEALDAARLRRPKAVLYDRATEDPAWREFCSVCSARGVPFVLLGRKEQDDSFLAVLTAGGYPAWADPLTTEEIVNAVSFAEEMSWLTRVEAVSG